MAKARKILARKKAINAIHTVTSTMEMVATARFKKTFNRCISARDYIKGISELVEDILRRCDRSKLKHPLILPRESVHPQREIIILTSDRGLCGSYNQTILKLADDYIKSQQSNAKDLNITLIGKKGNQLAKTLGITPNRSELAEDFSHWKDISQFADSMMTKYLEGEILSVEIFYTALVGTGKQEPTQIQLLPMTLPELPDEEDRWSRMEKRVSYEFIPSATVMLERILPMQIRLRMLECFTEAAVTEQIARMSAMRGASESAEDMIRELTVEYNRTRQSQITTELTEILGGQIALE